LKAEIGMKCCLCGRKLNKNTKPRWVINIFEKKLEGLAHTSCSNKIPHSSLVTLRSEWGSEPPSQEEIDFGCKIAKILIDDNIKPLNRLYVRIILYESLWKTRSIDEIFSSERIKDLLNWWEKGALRFPSERINQIKNEVINLLGG